MRMSSKMLQIKIRLLSVKALAALSVSLCQSLLGNYCINLYYICHWLLRLRRERYIAISLSVCLCLSVHEHISGTAEPIVTKFFEQIPRDRGSVLFWRCCDMLCTSGLWMTSSFAVMAYGDTLSGVAIPWRSLMCMNSLLLLRGMGAEYCDQSVCLSVCLSVRVHVSETARPIFTILFVQKISPVAVARSSSGGVAIPGRSLMFMNALL